jgi:hypothetical protein
MSDPITPTSAQNPPTDTTAPAPAPAPKREDGTPDWLPDRLQRAEQAAVTKALSTLGVKTLDEAKAVIEAAKKAEDAQKTEAQRTQERLAALEPEAQAAKAYRERLERFADAELGKLSEPQRAAVLRLADGDKAKALDAIEALRPTWQTAPPPAPPPPPATTAPPPTAPSSTAPSAVNVKEQYRALREKNPFAAAELLARHYRDITSES